MSLNPDKIVIDANRKWYDLQLRELWNQRELLLYFALRDIKVRYKQTILGSLWAFLHPFVTMVVFTVFFGKLVGLDKQTHGVPYALFVLSGLLPWNFFSGIFSKSSNCVVAGRQLVSKVYFPRLVLPLSCVGANLADFCIAFLILVLLMFYYSVTVHLSVLAIPFIVVWVGATAIGVSSCIAALTAMFRDFQFVSGYILQLWLYVTPVIYPLSIVPEKYKYLISLNPLVGAVETFRYCMFNDAAYFDPAVVLISFVTSVVMLVVGVLYFNALSPRFPDCV